MLTFLFWNMGGELPTKTPAHLVAERKARLVGIAANLTRQNDVDLLMLAECPLTSADILNGVNAGNSNPYHEPDGKSLCERVTIYPRFSRRFLSLSNGLESSKYTCRQVRLPGRPEVLLFAAHFASKLYKSEDSQTLSAPVFSQVIRQAEKRVHHKRTILVGDLNMNPFDPAVVGAEGLNAVMTRELTQRDSRTVDDREYPFFYNPMWGLFGDASHERYPPGHPDHEPPGTCYYKAGESKWYYWNMMDQVLLRPDLLPFFRNDELKILASDGATEFLDARGLPKREEISDHLPVLFRIHI